MALLTTEQITRLMTAVTSAPIGNAIADAINQGAAHVQQSPYVIANLIVATATSTTTDFGSLVVGDKILISPAVAGNSMFVTCATAGTLPQAAVVGSLYVVIRAYTAPTVPTVKF